MEDDLWWKTTYDGRRLMMEDDLWWKMTYDGRRLMMEDDLWWKTTSDGRQLLMEDDLWWKTTYDGRRHMMEDNLCWKTPYDGRRVMMEDDLWWKMTIRTTSKTKRTCTLVEGTRRWTYSTLRYFCQGNNKTLFFVAGTSRVVHDVFCVYLFNLFQKEKNIFFSLQYEIFGGHKTQIILYLKNTKIRLGFVFLCRKAISANMAALGGTI